MIRKILMTFHRNSIHFTRTPIKKQKSKIEKRKTDQYALCAFDCCITNNNNNFSS